MVNESKREKNAEKFQYLIDEWFKKLGPLVFNLQTWKYFSTKEYKEFMSIFDQLFV